MLKLVKAKRITSLEILKIICCIFVVTIHISNDYRRQGSVAWRVMFVESFIRCCVPVFFILTGYFIFQREKNIKEIYLRIIKEFVIPVTCLSLFNSIFADVIYNQGTFIESIKTYQFNDFIEFLKGIIRLQYPGPSVHLWYLNAVIGIYIAYPILKIICVNEQRINKIRHYLLGILFLGLIVIPTIERMYPELGNILNIPMLIKEYPYLYILIGYELSITTLKKQHKWLGAMLYFAGSILTFILCVWEVYLDGHLNLFFFDYQTLGVFISAVGIFLFFQGIKIYSETKIKVIHILAKQTYTIYLIHYILLMMYYSYGIRDYLESVFPKTIFYIVYVGLCFGSALLISLAFSYMKVRIKKVLTKRRNDIKEEH